MNDSSSQQPGLRRISERLRRERPQATALELDRIKLRAITRASRGRPGRRGLVGVRGLASVALVIGVLGGSTGVFAASGGFKSASSGHSAAESQYKPGKGCGDKNHIHQREDECKKPPK